MKLAGKTLKLARTLPFPLGLGITLGAGLLAVFNTIEYKKENKEKLLKSLYKELSRCESLALIYNDKIESVRDEYEELALRTQQEDADIEDYKAFIALTQQFSLYQEYRALLRQKKKYLSLLIAQVEEHPNKKTEMMDELLAEIGELENKEAELNKSVSNTADEDGGE
jgi:chromosome segregation ATPase